MFSRVIANNLSDGAGRAAVKDHATAINTTVDLTGSNNRASVVTVNPTIKTPAPVGSTREYQDMIKGSGVALFGPPTKKLKYSSASSEELVGLDLNTHASTLEILKQLKGENCSIPESKIEVTKAVLMWYQAGPLKSLWKKYSKLPCPKKKAADLAMELIARVHNKRSAYN